MAEVVWTRPSIQDLAEVRRFIGRDSRRSAQIVVDRIRLSVRRLVDFPLAGRSVPELHAGLYREVIAGRYRVIYRFDAEAERVLVLAVVHGARQLPSIEERG